MKNLRILTLAVVTAISFVTIATYGEELSATVPAPASTAKITGEIDLRPSVSLSSDQLYMEDTFELGYQFAPGRSISYVQYIEHNINNPAQATGFGLVNYNGFIRTRISNFWTDKENGLSLGYSNRTYLPTTTASRDAGMIATFRNYLNFSKAFGSTAKVTFSLLPIFGVYTKNGFAGKANPAFENRFYLTTDLNITSKLSFSVPVLFWFTKFHEAGGTSNSGATTWNLQIYPELGYAINDNFTVGMAYYSLNLVKKDLSGFALSDGLNSGVVQAFVTASL